MSGNRLTRGLLYLEPSCAFEADQRRSEALADLENQQKAPRRVRAPNDEDALKTANAETLIQPSSYPGRRTAGSGVGRAATSPKPTRPRGVGKALLFKQVAEADAAGLWSSTGPSLCRKDWPVSQVRRKRIPL
ncbi:hypothetical protein [Amycolatopsis azurea]|nr:hypothetical protein [Amycolatopsis azurea]